MAASTTTTTTTTNPSTKPGTCTLLLFASASTYCSSKETLTLAAPTTLFALMEHLERTWPGVGAKVLRSCQVVVNLDYVDVEMVEVVDAIEGKKTEGEKRAGEQIVVNPGDEVAVVPPVSSG